LVIGREELGQQAPFVRLKVGRISLSDLGHPSGLSDLFKKRFLNGRARSVPNFVLL
jgi:hypothetical protein